MTLTIAAATVAALAKTGATCTTATDESGKVVPVIVYRIPEGGFTACLNRCQHMNAVFAPDLEDIGMMKCTLHGWKLNPATMLYDETTNPGGQKNWPQPEYTVTMNYDGTLTLKPANPCIIA